MHAENGAHPPRRRAAVVGAGHIGQEHLACLSAMHGAQVVGVADLSPVTAEAAAERFGVPFWSDEHARLFEEVRPDVVHVATGVGSHADIARDALELGAHVVLEKPAARTCGELEGLLALAAKRGLHLIEDYSFLFHPEVQRLLALKASGRLGDLVHLDVELCLDVLASGSRFADVSHPHPSAVLPRGGIEDFLPHLASLVYAFLGRHLGVRTLWSRWERNGPMPYDEFRALVQSPRATAMMSFSAHAQPNIFRLRVDGTRMRVETNLFESGLRASRVRDLPRPLETLVNEAGESWATAKGAGVSLRRKLGPTPTRYEGLWELLRRTYRALDGSEEAPMSAGDIRAVNGLIRDLRAEGEAR
jgi:predicted dehydrogenase